MIWVKEHLDKGSHKTSRSEMGPMNDLLMIILLAAAFGGAGGYIYVCVDLIRPPG